MSTRVGQSRLTLRAIPLICFLCGTAGSIDATAYLLCSRVFVANMTGGTVLLAISLLQRNASEAGLRAGLVAAFVIGVMVSRFLARFARGRVTTKQRVFVLGVECLVLLMLAWKSTQVHTEPLLLLLACVLRVQNGAFRYIGGLHLNTTFVTGDLELLGEAIVDPWKPLPKVSAFVLSWVAYGGGALIGAVGARYLPDNAFLLPLILAAASTVSLAVTPDSRP